MTVLLRSQLRLAWVSHTCGFVDGGVDRANLLRYVGSTAHVESSMSLVLRGNSRPNEGSCNVRVTHLELVYVVWGG